MDLGAKACTTGVVQKFLRSLSNFKVVPDMGNKNFRCKHNLQNFCRSSPTAHAGFVGERWDLRQARGQMEPRELRSG